MSVLWVERQSTFSFVSTVWMSVCEREIHTGHISGCVKVCECVCVWVYVYNLSLSSHLFLETIGSFPSRHWTEGGRDKAAVLCSELTFHSDTNGRTHNFTNCPSWPAAQTEWISSANPKPAMCIWCSTDKAFPHNRAEKCYINTSREKERERQRKSLVLINLSRLVIALQTKPSLKEKEQELKLLQNGHTVIKVSAVNLSTSYSKNTSTEWKDVLENKGLV